MPIEVIMPKVDMDMATGKVMTWHIEQGGKIKKGEPLFDIETDKAAMEVEAPASGYLHHALPEGTDVAIGAPVAFIYAEGELVGERPGGPSEASLSATQAAPALEAMDEVQADREEVHKHLSDVGGRTRATPLARSLARGAGIDINHVADGTGPRGRVQAIDLQALLERTTPQAATVHFTPETGTLSVTSTRSGTGTPIVMIHGFGSDGTSWAPLEAQLKGHRLFRIDLPGHGKSPKLLINSFNDLVSHLRIAFDNLNLDKAHLVGHSLGGALALAIADTRPRKVASVSLIAPAGLGPQVNGEALLGICRATRPESLTPWLRLLVADEKLISDAYVRQVFGGRADPALRAAQSALSDVLFPDGVQAFDLRAALDRITAPTRIIWGRQDAIIPWKHVLCAPGHVALHLCDQIGHIPQIEDPERVGKILRNYL